MLTLDFSFDQVFRGYGNRPRLCEIPRPIPGDRVSCQGQGTRVLCSLQNRLMDCGPWSNLYLRA
jgi:hypothetical protein